MSLPKVKDDTGRLYLLERKFNGLAICRSLASGFERMLFVFGIDEVKTVPECSPRPGIFQDQAA